MLNLDNFLTPVCVTGALFLFFLLLYAYFSFRHDRIEHQKYIEHKLLDGIESISDFQESTEQSIIHLANAVKALEKMVRVSHGLPDATKVKYKKKKDD